MISCYLIILFLEDKPHNTTVTVLTVSTVKYIG